MEFQILQRGQNLTRCLRGVVCAAAILSSPASAQLMEVHPDGSIANYAGPVATTAYGIRAIGPQPGTARHVTSNFVADNRAVLASIQEAARRHQLSAQLVEAVAWQESHLRQNAMSPKGARGVMQLMPATARGLGVDAADLSANIDGGTAYLAQLMRRYDGDIVHTLSAYNASPSAVTRYGGVPPYAETRAYVAAVLDRLAAGTDVIGKIGP